MKIMEIFIVYIKCFCNEGEREYMEIINNIDIKLKKATAITIGKFDGLHIGHQRLLMHTEQYRKRGYKPLCLVFDTWGIEHSMNSLCGN